MSEPISVSSTVTIDHWELGREFWQWNNEEQAQFLHGLYVAMSDLRGVHGIQLLAVLDHAVKEGFESDLVELVTILYTYLTPEPTS